MRIKIVFTIAMTLVIFLSTGFAAHATVFTISDHNNYWGDNTSWSFDQRWTENSESGVLTANDKKDVVGYPNIIGGTVQTDHSGNLDKVIFNYSTWTNSLANRRGDLFVDLGDDGYWDYFVIGADRYANGNIRNGANVGYIYKLTSAISAKKGINDDAYVQSQDTWNIGGGIRENHPVWYNLSLLGFEYAGTADVYGFSGSNDTSIQFSGLNEILNIESDSFTIAWTPMCGNEIIISTTKVIPNPEPNTMLLLGFGIIGLAGFRRKFKKS